MLLENKSVPSAGKDLFKMNRSNTFYNYNKLISHLGIIFFLSSCGSNDGKSSFPFNSNLSVTNVGCLKNDGTSVLSDLPPEPNYDRTPYTLLWNEGLDISAPSSSLYCDQDPASIAWNDPLLNCQWYIQNKAQGIRSQSTLSPNQDKGIKGADLKLSAVMPLYQGTNYNIHISDSGIDKTHPELIDNFDETLSYDYCTGDKNPEPRASTPQGKVTTDHGTKVSGIIAAASNNGIGIAGIASKAKLSVDNAISICNTNLTINTWIPQLNINTLSSWSGSFGTDTEKLHQANNQGFDILNDVIATNAKTNNTVYFKAAGNERHLKGDANRDPFGFNIFISQIAAINQNFHTTFYSNSGSNILVSAIGAGEGGGDIGICTTDMNNKYTCNFNGTSAATPQVAAIALLIKESAASVGRTLSAIDVYTILARTAVPIDEVATETFGLQNKLFINNTVNSKMYYYSRNYGFGVVNAQKAIELAKSSDYQLLPAIEKLPTFTSSDCGNIKFQTNKTCAVKAINVSDTFQIYALNASFDIRPDFSSVSKSDSSKMIRQLIMTLISPDGQRSQLTKNATELEGSNYNHAQIFKSYAPFATDAKGKWFVEICAYDNKNIEATFSLVSAKLSFYGWKDQFPIPEKKFGP